MNLEDYTFTEIDLPNQWHMNTGDLSPDGTKVAVYGETSGNNDRQMLIYSLDNKKVLESYTLPRYIYKIIYNSDKQVFALSYYDDKSPAYEEHQGYLYIVDLE